VRNLRFTLAYDGTAYAGWQVQPDRPTVQGELQQAFFRLTGERAGANAAGRTDAGVHALGQVANIRTKARLPTDRLLLGLQHHLPDDIAVREVADMPADFHATLSAKRKTYRYVLHPSRVRDPFTRRYAWRLSRPLDAAAMAEAAGHLIGRHDFRCFETQGSPRADTVRTLFDVRVARCGPWSPMSPDAVPKEASDGPFVVIEVTGDGFLYNMVRAITGTLVEVGQGKRTPDSLAALLAAGRRAHAGQTAPPQGLFLVRVGYGENPEDRTQKTGEAIPEAS
jgi:tRNA pseudouridine38-40 synthase